MLVRVEPVEDDPGWADAELGIMLGADARTSVDVGCEIVHFSPSPATALDIEVDSDDRLPVEEAPSGTARVNEAALRQLGTHEKLTPALAKMLAQASKALC